MHVGDKHQQPGELLPACDDAELGCLLDRILLVSPPALASPTIFAFEALRLQQERGEIGVVEGHLDRAEHLAAVLFDDRRGVALQRMAERVIRGDEEPAVAARS